jgi:hypothetical protein
MAAVHLAQEFRFRVGDIGERLAGFGHRTEGDEIDRVPVLERDADLAVRLEAADSRSVAGARVDDHIGALPVEHLDAGRRRDLQEHVVAGAGEIGAVHHRFIVVDEHRRGAGGLMGDEDVAALAQRV